ncbi:hypothetical protein [Escherichia albertii]|uniref:hypothetical protein n=1 Tax=Escherichia albertii TaxID=208962 RepID=UPI001F49C580|nr:hypothetical protein [Escherichia albertii]
MIRFESGFDIKRFYFFPTTSRVAACDFRASGIAKGLLKNLQVSQVSRGMALKGQQPSQHPHSVHCFESMLHLPS